MPRTLLKTVGTLAVALLAAQAQAQLQPLETTSGWKAACETSPGNRVRVTTDLTVSVGFPAASPQVVNSGCTIELVGDSEIQFDKVGLRFNGPLLIAGGSKTGVAMQEATLSANSVELRLSGVETYLRTNRARIDATSGNLTLNFGSIAQVELFQSRFGGLPGTNGTLVASGRVLLNAGEKFNANLKEVVVNGQGGVNWQMSGLESGLAVNDSSIVSGAGAVALVNSQARAKGEYSNSSLRSAGNLDIAMASMESELKLSNVSTQSGARTQLYAAGAKSGVGVSNGSFTAGSLFFSAAAGSSEGKLVVEGARIAAGTPIRFVTGAQGATIVKGNTINGSGLVDVQSNRAAGGLCEALENRITAPLQQLCP